MQNKSFDNNIQSHVCNCSMLKIINLDKRNLCVISSQYANIYRCITYIIYATILNYQQYRSSLTCMKAGLRGIYNIFIFNHIQTFKNDGNIYYNFFVIDMKLALDKALRMNDKALTFQCLCSFLTVSCSDCCSCSGKMSVSSSQALRNVFKTRWSS